MFKSLFISIVIVFTLIGCASSGRVYDYTDGNGPRFISENLTRSTVTTQDQLHVVTYNIKFSEEIDQALALIQSQEKLREADIIFLQEMNHQSVIQIADALDLNYIYYPTSKHPYHEQDFGNAILSKWKFTDDEKIIFGPS